MNNDSKLNLKLGSVASINTAFGVLFQFLILYSYGVGVILDSYFIALSIIQFFYTILNTGILKVFTVKFKESEHYKLIFSQNLIVYLFTILVFSFVMYFFSEYIPAVFNNSEFSKNYFKILIFSLPFGVVTFICSSLLHSRKNHVTPELLSLISFILFIAFFLILYNKFPNYALPLSFILREAALSTLLFFKCRKNLVSNNLMKTNMIIFNELKVVFGGNIIYKAGPMIDKFLLAGFPSGSISILNYAELAFNSTNRVINRVFEQRLIVEFYENNKIKLGHFLKFILIGFIVAVCIFFIYPEIFNILVEYKIISSFNLKAFSKLNLYYSLLIFLSIIMVYLSSTIISRKQFNLLVGSGILAFIIGIFTKYTLITITSNLNAIPLGLILNYLLLILIFYYKIIQYEKQRN